MKQKRLRLTTITIAKLEEKLVYKKEKKLIF